MLKLSKAQARQLLPQVYTALEALAKDSAEAHRKAFALLAKIREKYDPRFKDVFDGWLADVQSELASASDVATKKELLAILKDAFSTDALLSDYGTVLDRFVKDYQQQFEEHVSQVAVDWNTAPQRAVDSLNTAVDKYFSRFASDQQSRLQQSLEDGLRDGLPIRDIAADIAAGMDTIVYRNADGEVYRTLTPEVWADMVARTETQRAYVTSTKEALLSADLATWQWLTGGANVCDECESNDEEIVAIGDAFPSGAEQPGDDHMSCRCTTIPVVSELTGDTADENSDEPAE